jgi:preprotein translocase subunit SecF
MSITAQRKTWFMISLSAVIASIASVFIFGLNLGLDFSGGARWDIRFNSQEEITQERLKAFFATQEVLTKEVQILPSEDQAYLITIEDLDDKTIQNIAAGLRDQVAEFEEISYRKVDANIGASFQKKAFYAIGAALIGMILFVAFAFRRVPAAINPWRFGGVAIIALFHDIVIVLGIFTVLSAFTGMELDLPFVTALLATLGFSVNDTIVILDRVRENIRLQKAHETFTDTVEKSVQETLRRSLFTSISTLFPLLGLLFFGADAIFYFVLALTLGIAVGTYSSIFLAAPLLAQWKIWADRRG